MSKTKSAEGLVLRYLTARALFRQIPWEMPANLEYLIGQGVRLLPGGVVVNEVALTPEPAIIYDRNDPEFWSAILGGEDNAIEMNPAEQEQVRQFVLSGGWALPVLRIERPRWKPSIKVVAFIADRVSEIVRAVDEASKPEAQPRANSSPS